jgi:RNA polymerase sigma factor (sigma-70 family)
VVTSRRLATRAGGLLRPGRQDPLIVRARDQPELFAEFYAENHEQVLRFFARRTLDPETAFDLMAETFASAFAALPSFRGHTDDEGHAWLWVIARNQLYGWSRRGSVERNSLAALGVELSPIAPLEFERIEELAALDRIKDELRAALESLAPDQRVAVRMRIIDEQPYAAIARTLGITEQVARARVSRGLRELARTLKSQQTALREAIG